FDLSGSGSFSNDQQQHKRSKSCVSDGAGKPASEALRARTCRRRHALPKTRPNPIKRVKFQASRLKLQGTSSKRQAARSDFRLALMTRTRSAFHSVTVDKTCGSRP